VFIIASIYRFRATLLFFCLASTVESDVLGFTCLNDNQVQPFEYPVCMAIDVVYTL